MTTNDNKMEENDKKMPTTFLKNDKK